MAPYANYERHFLFVCINAISWHEFCIGFHCCIDKRCGKPWLAKYLMDIEALDLGVLPDVCCIPLFLIRQ